MRLGVVVMLVACAGRSSRPCPATPAPTADDFATCGGMLYHTPPGSAVRFTIKFNNTVGLAYELKDLCVLLDGAPLFTSKQIETAPKDVTWDGRISYAQHRVQVQAIYAMNGQMYAVRIAKDIGAIDGSDLEIIAFEHDKKPAIKMKLPKDTPEPKCEH